MIKGVITGDVVNSTNIAVQWKSKVIEVLNDCVSDFSGVTSCKLEIFRGDSFQIVVDDSALALSLAIVVRAKLKAATPTSGEIWDARIALGIGDVSYESESIVTSDGEAFRLSGRAFDSLGRRRLSVVTPWQKMNEDCSLNTKFADDIISSWTVKQANVVYSAIINSLSQKDLAEYLGMTLQNTNKIWNSSRCSLILEYIDRYKAVLKEYKDL